MGYKLVCEEFKTDSFSNGDSNEWNIKIKYVDALVSRNGLEDAGVKDLFYSLLQQGVCYSASEDRLTLVQDILIDEGYEIDERR